MVIYYIGHVYLRPYIYSFKTDKTKVTLLFQIFYLFEPKIEIFYKYFLDKKFPKVAIVYLNAQMHQNGWYSYMSVRINVMLFCTFWAMRTTKFIVSNLLSMYHFEIEGFLRNFIIHIYSICTLQMLTGSYGVTIGIFCNIYGKGL